MAVIYHLEQQGRIESNAFNTNWWIDDSGTWNPFLERLDPTMLEGEIPTDNLFPLAFRDLGIVLISFQGKVPTLQWDAESVSDLALQSAKMHLSDFGRRKPVRLTYHYHGWVSEFFESGEQALARIEEVEAHTKLPLVRDVFLRNRPDWHNVRTTPLIESFLQRFDAAGGCLDKPEMQPFLSHLLIYRWDERVDGLKVEAVGLNSPCARYLGKEWAREAPGKLYDHEYPGKAYSARVSPAYAEVLQGGEPRLDEIRASIRRSHALPRWAGYQRLLVRASDATGQPMLALLADLTEELSIPLFAA